MRVSTRLVGLVLLSLRSAGPVRRLLPPTAGWLGLGLGTTTVNKQNVLNPDTFNLPTLKHGDNTEHGDTPLRSNQHGQLGGKFPTYFDIDFVLNVLINCVL